MKKLNNSEVALNKGVAYKKSLQVIFVFKKSLNVERLWFVYCVCLKSKTLCIYLFSPFSSSSRLLQNIEEFGANKYFTDHHTPNAITDFRDSVPVRKMHDCYSRIRKKIRATFHPFKQCKQLQWVDGSKPLQKFLNVFNTTYTSSNCLVNQLFYC